MQAVQLALPGVLPDDQLLGAVPDASSGGTNQLLNPIDGQPILVEVYGNPRVRRDGSRDIGAVQVPVPGTALLLTIGIGLAGFARRRQG